MKTLVGKKIRKIRLEKGYSQEYMAQRLSMSAAGFSKIERGETDMSLGKVVEIAEILEVESQTLLNADEVQILNFNNSHQNTVGNREAHVNYNANDKVIELLEKTVAFLQTETTRLIDIIGGKRGTE